MDRIGHLPYTHLFSKHGYGYTDIDMVQQGKLISVSATDVDVNPDHIRYIPICLYSYFYCLLLSSLFPVSETRMMHQAGKSYTMDLYAS